MNSSAKRCRFTPVRLREDNLDQVAICKAYILQGKDPDDLLVKEIDAVIGKGLFAGRRFHCGEFLVEYHGELISKEEACTREGQYHPSLGSYMFFFRHKGKELCMDATFSTRKGRFINDGVTAEKNSEVKVVEISDRPFLAVFATRNIKEGDEIRYDYGVLDLPWRESKKLKDKNSSTAFDSRSSETDDHIETEKVTEDLTRNTLRCISGLKECVVTLDRLPVQEPLVTFIPDSTVLSTTLKEHPDSPDLYLHDEEPSSSRERCKFTLQDFLAVVTSNGIANMALSNNYLIQEEDVETIPDNLKQYSEILDDELLSAAEPYFSEDAWECLQNTLCILNEQRNKDKSKKYQKIEGDVPTTATDQDLNERNNNTEGDMNLLKKNTKKYKRQPHNMAEQDKNIARNSSNSSKKTRIKPHRPCPFCHKFMSKLRIHLEKKHKDEDEVKRALLLPKYQRDKAFDALRKKGILRKNIEAMKADNHLPSDLIRERTQGDSKDLTYCSNCYAFISKRLFHRHKSQCYMSNNSTDVPQPMLTAICAEKSSCFEKEILSSFQCDDIGEVCRSEPLIVKFGGHVFKKVTIHADKKDEKRKALRSDMRRLGKLYLSFKDNCQREGITCESAIAMFERSNFSILERSIDEVSANSDGTFKDGTKVGLGYLLKKVGKYIYGDYLVSKADDKAKEINKFLSLLQYQWLHVFGDSEYAVKKVRQSVLRKPQNLPLSDDVQLLRDYTVENIKKIVNDKYKFIEMNDYILLRDLLVCRLTLFNARRGGEPSRLTISEWEDAENDVWHDNTTTEKVTDPLDKVLFGRYKLAYQPGKLGKLVPLLVIDDCWDGIRLLVDPEIRSRIGVAKANIYVFPYTQLSTRHVIGWNAVNRCCKLAKCSKAINATSRRHQVATLYAAHEVSQEERAGFLLHMDHAESTNLNVYQSPPSRQEITKVGRVLLELDTTGTYSSTARKSGGPFTAKTKRNDQREMPPLNKGDTTSRQNSPTPGRSLDDSESRYIKESAGEENVKRSRLSVALNEDGRNKRPRRQKGDTTPGQNSLTLGRSLVDVDDSESRYMKESDSEDSGTEYIATGSPETSESDSVSMEIECEKQRPQRRRYKKWDEVETRLIRDYFKNFIFSLDNLDSNKGKLPGKTEIEKFLQEHPDVLRNETMGERIKGVKLKVFNERKTVRDALRKI